MTRNRARGVCRMRDLQRDIRYVYDLIDAMRENNVKGPLNTSLQDAA